MAFLSYLSGVFFVILLIAVIPEFRRAAIRLFATIVGRSWLFFAPPLRASDDPLTYDTADTHEPSRSYTMSVTSSRRGPRGSTFSGVVGVRFSSFGFFRHYIASLDGCRFILIDPSTGDTVSEFPFHGGRVSLSSDARVFNLSDAAGEMLSVRTASAEQRGAWKSSIERNLRVGVAETWVDGARRRGAGGTVM